MQCQQATRKKERSTKGDWSCRHATESTFRVCLCLFNADLSSWFRCWLATIKECARSLALPAEEIDLSLSLSLSLVFVLVRNGLTGVLVQH